MALLSALWLPIVLSAVIVFVASSIMHMALSYHRSDYQRLPDEDKVLAAVRGAGLKRGLYIFPFTTHKDMKSPAVVEKYNQGPVGMMTIAPNGPPVMPKIPRCAHRGAGRVLSGRVPCRGDSGVPRLWPGMYQQQHLERADLEHDH